MKKRLDKAVHVIIIRYMKGEIMSIDAIKQIMDLLRVDKDCL